VRRLAGSAVAAAVIAVCPGLIGAGQDLLDFKDSNAREILRRGRAAVGGPGGVDTIAHLQSLSLSGLSRIPANTGLVECNLEIRILLPDHYLRIERASFGEKRSGFSAKNSLSVISERGRTLLPPDNVIDQIVESERERMLQLLLGAAAYLTPRDVVLIRSLPGDLGSTQAQATAASGSGDAQRRRQQSSGDALSAPTPAAGSGVTGGQTLISGLPSPYSFDVAVRRGAPFRFSVDPGTFLPAKLSYTNAGGDEVTMVFGERRATEGLKLPYRITTTIRGKIVDDLLLDHIEVNPKLTADDFR
jgi:hypothetical protein